MFKKLLFYYDCDGNPRVNPLELKAADVRAKWWSLTSSTYRTTFGTMPAICIVRSWKNLKTDPYNEDGRPPTVWTTIVHPHVEFCGSWVEIFGFESPNMGFAGLAQPAYSMCPPLKLPPSRIWDKSNKPSNHIHDLPRQKIVLIP